MPAISYIGATIGCVVGVPATIDLAGFGALSFTTIGKIASFGSVGDNTNDVPIDLLEGRVEHVSGAKDGGEVAFSVRYEASDAGQILLLANNNGNNELSFRIVDPDGKLTYFYGKVANYRDNERTSSSYKGYSGVIRVNSATIRN